MTYRIEKSNEHSMGKSTAIYYVVDENGNAICECHDEAVAQRIVELISEEPQAVSLPFVYTDANGFQSSGFFHAPFPRSDAQKPEAIRQIKDGMERTFCKPEINVSVSTEGNITATEGE